MWWTVALANQRLPRRTQMDLSIRDETITVARQSTENKATNLEVIGVVVLYLAPKVNGTGTREHGE